MKGVLNYLGGKSRLAKTIVKLMPENHTCYCEPFCGGAWVLFSKPPSKSEVINDMDGELITFFRVIQNHLEEFLRYYKFAVISRSLFELHKKERPDMLTDVQRAVRFYYLQRLCFGGHTSNRHFAANVMTPGNLNLATLEESLLKAHWRLHRVTIEHLDAIDCIQRYDRPSTLFYMDPPYWNTAGYAVPWDDEDYLRLRAALDSLKGRFILSLNDVSRVRSTFKGFTIKKVQTRYSCEDPRAGRSDRSRLRKEVIIHNV